MQCQQTASRNQQKGSTMPSYMDHLTGNRRTSTPTVNRATVDSALTARNVSLKNALNGHCSADDDPTDSREFRSMRALMHNRHGVCG
jgi:hypothetical protein